MTGKAAELFDDYQRTGRLDLLNAAIELFGDAVAATAPDHPDRPGRLSDLGNALCARFGSTGQLTDVDEAIAALRDAVATTAVDHPERPGRLSSLGGALHARFGSTADPTDLEQAIIAGRDAVTTTPVNHPERPRYLSALGQALQTRFQRVGQQGDLDDAVVAWGDSVSTAPPGHSNRHAYLSKFPSALQRFARTGEVAPQRSGGRMERPPDDRGGGGVTTRLVLLALTIVLVLLGSAGGLVGAVVLPKIYAARVEVLSSIGQDQQSGDPLKQDRQLSTQLVFLKSRAVLGPVAQKEGTQFEDLDKVVSVKVVDNSEVIQVEADGPTKLAATQTLQAIMDRYLTLVSQPTAASRNLDTQLADAKTDTAQIQTRVNQLMVAVVATTATQISLNEARVQLAASLDREKAIQAKIAERKLSGQAGPDVQLLTPPYSLPDAVFPQPLIAAGTGALVGLIVAGGAVAVELLRRR